MMTSEALHDWLKRFDNLKDEMLESGATEELMIAATMCSLSGNILAARSGDPSYLVGLYRFSGGQSEAFIKEATANAN